MVEFIFSQVSSEVFTITQILIAICALFLLALTLKAYKNTGLRKMIYLIIAFGLFAFQHIFNYVDQAVLDIVSDDIRYVIFAITTLCIMGMFFLAILKK